MKRLSGERVVVLYKRNNSSSIRCCGNVGEGAKNVVCNGLEEQIDVEWICRVVD